jgi:drug/metabolite transporter (DMT)-like permease
VSLPVFVWLLLSSVWGSTWLFIKIGLADLPPFSFAGVRFVIAAAPLVAWLAVRRAPLPRAARDWRLMVVTGWLTFTVNYTLVFWGEQHISAGLAAILYTTFPIIGMLQAHWLLPDEPLTARKLGGALLSLAGVVVIFYNQVQLRGPLALAGSAAVVVAATATAYADILIKHRGGHIEPVTMTAVQMVAGFIPMLVLAALLEGNPFALSWTPRAVVSIVYLALVGSSLTFVLLYWLIQRAQVTRVMFIPFFSTVVAVLLDAVVLGERLDARTIGGGMAIMGGLAVALSARSGRTVSEPAP